MAGLILPFRPDPDAKVALMQEDARFEMTEADLAQAPFLETVRRQVRSRTALPKVPKVFLSNDCIFNCAYCGCRQSNEWKQCYSSSPRELAELAYAQHRWDGHGIFISSAIFQNPDYTEELIIRAMRILRRDLGYAGYLHAKVMPGTDPDLIALAGQYADRLSVNIEVARSEGYSLVAQNKNKRNILTPMRQISQQIAAARGQRGRFATSQTTQLMAGSCGEDDYTILNLSGALYSTYHLSRVYYTAFHYTRPAQGYDHLRPVITPPWRMRRLYQADRLMQLYGFSAEELTPPEGRFLTPGMDPKAAWALRNLHLFPLEVNRAPLEMLIRVPGIGLTYAKRIVQARKACALSHESLRKLGVSLKRSGHFITCGGRYAGQGCEHPEKLRGFLLDPPQQLRMELAMIDGGC